MESCSMKRSQITKVLICAFSFALPVMTVNADIPLSLANGPLAVNTGVDPNVMLLLDNSGSMDNVIWDVDRNIKQADGTEKTRAAQWPAAPAAFVPGNSYTDWCLPDCNSYKRWYKDSGNNLLLYVGFYINYLYNPKGATCANGQVEGYNGTIYKCLTLPDPAVTDHGGNLWRTRYTGQYLNYLFSTYIDGAELTNTTLYPWIPQTTRMQEARSGASALVSSITGVRFGLSTFNPTYGPDGASGDGAYVNSICGTAPATIDTNIKGILAVTNTPLAESYYELTRYFRGLSSFYSNRTYTSPVQYRCQQNFAVVITDGLPTADRTFPLPADDPDIQSGCSSTDPSKPCLPNWDQLATAGGTYPVYPHFSDGVTPTSPYGSNEGDTLFLDDMAKFGYDLDLRKAPDVDLAGISFDDPTNNAEFAKQNLKTFTIGFTTGNNMLADAADYGQDYLKDNLGKYILDSSGNKQKIQGYYTASEGTKLKDSLLKILQTIKTTSGSAAAVASSTGFISQETLLFQAQYDTSFWEGRLLAYQLDSQGNLQPDNINPVAEWDAGSILTNTQTYTGRNIITYDSDAVTPIGVPFEWANISTTMQGLLGSADILNYVRGDQSKELIKADGSKNPTGIYRPRGFVTRDNLGNVTSFKPNILGDIIDSAPIYVGKPNFPYPDVWPSSSGTAPENCVGCKYSDFRIKYSYNSLPTPNNLAPAYDRGDYPLVYVGANDGMLHAFKATNYIPGTTTLDPKRGYEKLAYVPRTLYKNLANLSSTTYNHQFYVDGSPTIVDAFYKGRDGTTGWHTTLAGGLNKGGQGIYVLDVTDPKSFAETTGKANDIVQWEFNDSNDADLGYTYSQPLIARMSNNKWAVIFGNGYNNTDPDGNASTTGDAVLYIAFIEAGVDGKWTAGDFVKIDTGVGLKDDPKNATVGTAGYDSTLSQPNGLAGVSAVDVNDDYVTDYIYAGDLYGNMWKFDVRDPNTAKWTIYNKSGNTPIPFFIAEDKTGKRQPITSSPEAIRAANNSTMVLFGTGKYLETTDTNSTTATTQSFYGVIDDGSTSTHGGRSTMLEQTVLNEQPRTFTNPKTGAVATQLVRETSNNGADQYVDWFMDLPAQGERVVYPAIARGFLKPHIIFVSIIPGDDPCSAGGNSWLMELDARDGSKTKHSVFDLNYDGSVSTADNAGSTVLNGWKQTGIQTAPSIIAAGDTEKKFLSSSTGSIRTVTEAAPKASAGRQSWQQLK